MGGGGAVPENLEERNMTWIEIPKSSLERKADKLLGITKEKKKKRARKLSKIPSMTYGEYMGSAYWRKRKQHYFSKHGRKCAVCGKKWGTTLHHTFYDYKSFGSEPDDHFTPLCGQHHKEYHEIHGTQKDMRESTKKYVIHARQMYIFEEESIWIKSL